MANKVEKLLLVDEKGVLTGLITIKDIDMLKRFPNACKDKQGRLRVGAAVVYSILKELKALFPRALMCLLWTRHMGTRAM